MCNGHFGGIGHGQWREESVLYRLKELEVSFAAHARRTKQILNNNEDRHLVVRGNHQGAKNVRTSVDEVVTSLAVENGFFLTFGEVVLEVHFGEPRLALFRRGEERYKGIKL